MSLLTVVVSPSAKAARAEGHGAVKRFKKVPKG
jgi:hypothetical protein